MLLCIIHIDLKHDPLYPRNCKNSKIVVALTLER